MHSFLVRKRELVSFPFLEKNTGTNCKKSKKELASIVDFIIEVVRLKQ